MSGLKLNQISIVMLGVANVERSLTFYRDLLGLPVKSQMPGFAFLDAGTITLALSEPLAKAVPTGAGATEIVFPVTHVKEAVAALAALGVVFSTEPRNVTGPFWAANFTDPDGHHLSLFGNE